MACTVLAQQNYSPSAYYPKSYTVRQQPTRDANNQAARTPHAPTPRHNHSSASASTPVQSTHQFVSLSRCLNSIQNQHYPRHP